MVKVIIRSLGLILPVFPLSRARKMLRSTMSASHLQQPSSASSFISHISESLLGKDFPHNLDDLRFGDLTLREANFKTVPQFNNLAICQLLTLNKNQQLFCYVLWNWINKYFPNTFFEIFCFGSFSFLSSGFLADLVLLILTSESSAFMMIESMNVFRVSVPFTPSETAAVFLVFFFFDSVEIEILLKYLENYNLCNKKRNFMIDFWQ